MLRGPYKKNQRAAAFQLAIELRKAGFGYRRIAAKTGVAWGTIRNWVEDLPVNKTLALKLAGEERRADSSSKLRTRGAVRAFLARTRGYRCEECGLSEWRGFKLPLEVEHINGRRTDHRDCNVKLLCPNCHALTPTWRRKKKEPA